MAIKPTRIWGLPRRELLLVCAIVALIALSIVIFAATSLSRTGPTTGVEPIDLSAETHTSERGIRHGNGTGHR